jgi:cell division protease FtsH
VNSSSTAKTILFWISIVFLGVMLWRLVSANGSQTHDQTPSYSEFMAKVDEGDIKEVTLYLSPNSYEIQGEYKTPPNTKFTVTVFKEAAPDLVKELRDKGAMIKGMKEVRSSDWILILLNAAPLLLLVGFCFFLMRQMQAGGNKALSFGKSRARLLSAQIGRASCRERV